MVDTIYATFHAEMISQNRPLVSAPNIVLECYMCVVLKPIFHFSEGYFAHESGHFL